MKKIFTLAFLMACILISQAQTSMLTFSTTGSSNLKIRFNGKKYSLQDRSATFQNMTPGVYPVTIFQLQKNPSGSGNIYKEVFNNNVTLTASKHLEVTVLRFGKLVWDEGAIPDDDWADTYNNPVGSTGVGGYPSNQAVDADQFDRIKKAIRDATFDNEMYKTAQVVLKNNLLTVPQIRQLAKLFTFDDGKLNLLKLAYDNCVNKGDYFSLADALTFDNSKNELLNYIKSR